MTSEEGHMAAVSDIFKYKFVEVDINKLIEHAKANARKIDGETRADADGGEK